MPPRGFSGLGVAKPGTKSVYTSIANRLAGGQPLSYIGASGFIESTGGTTGAGGGIGGGGGGVSGGGGAGGTTAVTGGSDIMDLYAKALERLSTGGLSLEASLADIEEGKRQAIARGQQSLVSGGLGGTTVMGGVPVAAEKTAGRARLAARGEAESKYLTTLASFAAFAQRAQEASAERAAAMDRLKLQLGTQERLATQELTRPYGGREPPKSMPGGPSYMARTAGLAVSPTPTPYRPPGAGYYGNYSQQFPSIYDQGEAEKPAPNWI